MSLQTKESRHLRGIADAAEVEGPRSPARRVLADVAPIGAREQGSPRKAGRGRGAERDGARKDPKSTTGASGAADGRTTVANPTRSLKRETGGAGSEPRRAAMGWRTRRRQTQPLAKAENGRARQVKANKKAVRASTARLLASCRTRFVQTPSRQWAERSRCGVFCLRMQKMLSSAREGRRELKPLVKIDWREINTAASCGRPWRSKPCH